MSKTCHLWPSCPFFAIAGLWMVGRQKDVVVVFDFVTFAGSYCWSSTAGLLGVDVHACQSTQTTGDQDPTGNPKNIRKRVLSLM